MELVLYYNPLPLTDTTRLRSLLAAQGVELRPLSAVQLGQTVGHLSGVTGYPAAQAEGGSFSEPVMVFCGFTRERLDTVMDALRAGGAPKALKAVRTPTNASWSLLRLAEELQSERAEIAKALQKKEM